MAKPMYWLHLELQQAARELRERDERRIRAEEMRGEVAWFMNVTDLRIGHELLGFDYPVNGDERPTIESC